MKKIGIVVGLGLIGMISYGQGKSIAEIEKVVGTVRNRYALVRTDIYRINPGDPVVVNRATHSVYIGPDRIDSGQMNVPLSIPSVDVKIQTHAAPQLVNALGRLVGAVSTNPKGKVAGVGISAAGVIADYATKVAERELNDAYGTQGYQFTVLEILPMHYYRIDTSTNKVEVTDEFLEDFPKYQKQVQRYIAAFKLYNDINQAYTRWRNRFYSLYAELFSLGGAAAVARQEKLLAEHYAEVVEPALKVKNKEERALANMYPPYRIAIMASPSDPGTACSRFGSGKGPWQFNIVYYAGAQQTDKIAINFCVPNDKAPQLIQVSLAPNTIRLLDKLNQVFIAGGIKLLGRSNINFAQPEGVEGYGARETEIFNWFNSMVTQADGGDISQFLLPFDIYSLKKTYMEDKQAREDVEMSKILGSFDAVIDRAEKASKAMKEESDRLKDVGDTSQYGKGKKSYGQKFGEVYGETESLGDREQAAEIGIPADEEAEIREWESKGQELDRDLASGAPSSQSGSFSSASTTNPQGTMSPAGSGQLQLPAPLPETVPVAWQDRHQVMKERTELVADIEIAKDADIKHRSADSATQLAGRRTLNDLNRKWHPDKVAGEYMKNRYTQYFVTLKDRNIAVLDNFLRDLGYSI